MEQEVKDNNNSVIEDVTGSEYKYGFTSDIDTDVIGRGLNEDVIRLISAKKGEPEWLLEYRLKAYRHWLTLTPPTWAHLNIPEIDFQDIIYYAAPKAKEGPRALTRLTPSYLKHSTARYSARRAETPRRHGSRCRDGLSIGQDHPS